MLDVVPSPATTPSTKKYQTKIGSRVFVGSDTQFVAPITIGDDVIIGSGSTITKSVPSGALAVARGRQVIKENYNKNSESKKKDDQSSGSEGKNI